MSVEFMKRMELNFEYRGLKNKRLTDYAEDVAGFEKACGIGLLGDRVKSREVDNWEGEDSSHKC
jgi:hypothetical protein